MSKQDDDGSLTLEKMRRARDWMLKDMAKPLEPLICSMPCIYWSLYHNPLQPYQGDTILWHHVSNCPRKGHKPSELCSRSSPSLEP